MYVVKINSCEQIKNNFTDYYIFVMLTLICQTLFWTYTGGILSFIKVVQHLSDVSCFTANLLFDVPGKRQIYRTITMVVKY